jgi:hypothetical protein
MYIYDRFDALPRTKVWSPGPVVLFTSRPTAACNVSTGVHVLCLTN